MLKFLGHLFVGFLIALTVVFSYLIILAIVADFGMFGIMCIIALFYAVMKTWAGED